MSSCIRYSNDEIPDHSAVWRPSVYVLGLEGDNPALLMMQAEVLLEKAEYRDAWAKLNREDFRFISDAKLSFLKGKTAYHLGNNATAQRLLEDARELGYSGDELFYYLSANALAAGDTSAAINTVSTLLQLREKPEFHTLKGEVLLLAGDTVAASSEFVKSMKQDSGIRSNYLGLYKVALAKGENERALNVLNAWTERSARDKEFLLLKASLLSQEGRYVEAGQIYSDFPEPQSPEVLQLRASNYLEMGIPDSAMLYAAKAIVLNDDPDIRLILARSREAQRLYEEAEADYLIVLRADSANTEAKEGLERLERRRNYLQFLREQRERELQAAPPSPSRINPADSLR